MNLFRQIERLQLAAASKGYDISLNTIARVSTNDISKRFTYYKVFLWETYIDENKEQKSRVKKFFTASNMKEVILLLQQIMSGNYD